MFGDYYFVEAIARLLFPGKLSPAHKSQEPGRVASLDMLLAASD
jgi:hypothetical protein